MRDIVIIGASEHAKVLIDIIEKEGRFRIAGLLDRAADKPTSWYGYPLLGRDDALPALMARQGLTAGIIAIGDNRTRALCRRRLAEIAPGFEFVSAVHPSAQVARGAKLGQGVAVMAGAVINSDARVGDFCILNTNSSLDHDGVMDDFSSLGPGACLGGQVRIGEYTAVCLGARIIHGVTVGAHVVIGAGATVLTDIPERCLAHGTPARVVRPRQEDEKYL